MTESGSEKGRDRIRLDKQKDHRQMFTMCQLKA